MLGRIYTSSDQDYNLGFNGKYKSDEVKGAGVHYDYGFRIYDRCIAKFLSVDPLTKSYSILTSYQFASNSPNSAIDLDGLEAWIVIFEKYGENDPIINLVFDNAVQNMGGVYEVHKDYDSNNVQVGLR